ncbi:MAG: amylo-alpha-1,6-glucosidase, partial [Ilumatobacteraceae bacterium]
AGRRLALAALDPVLVFDDRRVELATREWQSGAIAPHGHEYLAGFELIEGVPRWTWQVDDVVLEAEVAMVHGRPAVGIVHRLLHASRPIRLELRAVATWRDVHGERTASGEPPVAVTSDGFVFDGAYRVRGPGFQPAIEWWYGSHQREEALRGLPASEDLAHAGDFSVVLSPGDVAEVEAWADLVAVDAPNATDIVVAARQHYHRVARRAKAGTHIDRVLAHAADQFVVDGPAVVAGYPWFGDWSRDTFTSYEGLFLCTGRYDEGRQLLLRAAATVSEGMLANTADAGGQPEYNTADATMWFLHALCRHIELTDDLELLIELMPTISSIIDAHIAGTRYGIRVDPGDGLITQGADGLALTWMDARVDGSPITCRAGKTVEINALWISALSRLADLAAKEGVDGGSWRAAADRARASFVRRYIIESGSLADVVDGRDGDDHTLRPNQLIAAALPSGPLDAATIASVLDAVVPLITPLGLRSLDPTNPAYRGQHRGDQAERDLAYHQGTVWPWLIGPYVEASLRAGRTVEGVLVGLENHLAEFGLGSVSETADGDAPHGATGCPFQAWSVAELLRARRLAPP